MGDISGSEVEGTRRLGAAERGGGDGTRKSLNLEKLL